MPPNTTLDVAVEDSCRCGYHLTSWWLQVKRIILNHVGSASSKLLKGLQNTQRDFPEEEILPQDCAINCCPRVSLHICKGYNMNRIHTKSPPSSVSLEGPNYWHIIQFPIRITTDLLKSRWQIQTPVGAGQVTSPSPGGVAWLIDDPDQLPQCPGDIRGCQELHSTAGIST